MENLKKHIRRNSNTYTGHYWLFAVVVLISGTLGCNVAKANQAYDWPYVRVGCDPNTQEVSITETSATAENEIPNSPDVRGLDGMYRLHETSDGGGVLVQHDKFTKTCHVAHSIYAISIEPYKFNTNTQGMCGAAPPSARLTVLRNGRILVKNIVFKISCLADSGAELAIGSIKIFELRKMIRFEIVEDERPLTKEYSFSQTPGLVRAELSQQPR